MFEILHYFCADEIMGHCLLGEAGGRGRERVESSRCKCEVNVSESVLGLIEIELYES
jgi:hypothetical protein